MTTDRHQQNLLTPTSLKSSTLKLRELYIADGHVAEGTAYIARASMLVWASSFAVGETALGLACLPSFKPLAYGSFYLWCLHLTVLIHCFIFPGTRAETGFRACFCFEALLTPMCLAILGQVFWFGWKLLNWGISHWPLWHGWVYDVILAWCLQWPASQSQGHVAQW